jgi:hypothetical protein
MFPQLFYLLSIILYLVPRNVRSVLNLNSISTNVNICINTLTLSAQGQEITAHFDASDAAPHALLHWEHILAFPLLASTRFIATSSINTTRAVSLAPCVLLRRVPSCVVRGGPLQGPCRPMLLFKTFVHPFNIQSISCLRVILPCTVASPPTLPF